jgi:hypothetical protein
MRFTCTSGICRAVLVDTYMYYTTHVHVGQRHGRSRRTAVVLAVHACSPEIAQHPAGFVRQLSHGWLS